MPRSAKTAKSNIIGVCSSVFRGGGMRRWSPPGRSEKVLTRYTVKNGISNLYILLRSALKMQEMPFQRPISGGGLAPAPLQLCRHYGLPLTKILATPLGVLYAKRLQLFRKNCREIVEETFRQIAVWVWS